MTAGQAGRQQQRGGDKDIGKGRGYTQKGRQLIGQPIHSCMHGGGALAVDADLERQCRWVGGWVGGD